MLLDSERALVRGVPSSFAECELTWVDRHTPDLALARRQHADYVDQIAQSGLEVVAVEADDSHPDCPFVEDIALDLGHMRVLTSPGAASRRGERGPVADVLGPHTVMPGGVRLDGGDVIQVRDTLFIGRSTRTDQDAVAWLAEVSGLKTVSVGLKQVLHLKTAATALDQDTLLAWKDSIDETVFGSMEIVHTDGPNVLVLPDRVLVRAGTRTEAILSARGHQVVPMSISEFTLAEASLTCMSVLMGAA